MKTLAFDTSTNILTIAVFDKDAVLASYHNDVGIQHSKVLVSTIDEVLTSAGVKLSEIDLICAGMGPGSFTGLRIASATVKGFASAINAKVIGVPTMDAIVMNALGRSGRVAPLMDARKSKVYTCIYDLTGSSFTAATEHMLLTADEVLAALKERTVFFGDGVDKYKEKLDGCEFAEAADDIDWFPKAENIGKIAIERFSGRGDDPAYLEPMYLHEKECNITKPKSV